MSSGMTRPKPLHTESSLLAAMETAGRDDVEDEEARQALKDCGIGTPATRAAIIETLLRREYMVRVKKSLVPTEKGLALYSIVKEMDIANVEMTGRWEAELAKIEQGKTPHEAFMRDIESYTRKITTDLLACDRIFGYLPQMRHGYDAVLRQGCALRQPGLPAARVPPDSGQDTHRRGNDRSADGRKDGDARRVQEQAGQALQRCGDF